MASKQSGRSTEAAKATRTRSWTRGRVRKERRRERDQARHRAKEQRRRDGTLTPRDLVWAEVKERAAAARATRRAARGESQWRQRVPEPRGRA